MPAKQLTSPPDVVRFREKIMPAKQLWTRDDVANSFSDLYIEWEVKDCETGQILHKGSRLMYFKGAVPELTFEIARSDAYRGVAPFREGNRAQGMSDNVVLPGGEDYQERLTPTWSSDKTCGSIHILTTTWIFLEETAHEILENHRFFTRTGAMYPSDLSLSP